MKPSKKACDMSVAELAAYIDYSVLKPEFTEQEIIDLTKDGVRLECATICINPAYMELCDSIVKGTKTMLCPVTDFPFGASSTESRVNQVEMVAKYDTVKEVDIVINYGMLRSGNKDGEILADLKAVTEAAHKYGREIKVIIETDALNEEQIVRGTRLVMESGADFVKTSTGFLTGYEAFGATPEVIAKMMEVTQGKIKIKGAGCIRTREHFLQLIDMGIDRMGVGYRSVPVVLDLKK
ncbi:MAG: deoxyribose-phosphate aldolase [Eubacterium sp.]|nr:deoxyribose-phosphate aldolase [Eubacterium sp.]